MPRYQPLAAGSDLFDGYNIHCDIVQCVLSHNGAYLLHESQEAWAKAYTYITHA